MNTTSARTAIGVGVLGATLIFFAPAASADTHEQQCQRHGGSYGSIAPGDGHVYSSCSVNGTTIGWKDGKDPVTYPTPK